MGIFLLILFITLLGFGDAFLRIAIANEVTDENDYQFTKNFVTAALFSYQMILGTYDTTSFG